MTRTETWPGRIALMVTHCAGMVDLVALPVWVGTLISDYRLDPQQAGGLVTLFLLGAVGSSLFFAPRFNRIRGRTATSVGFGVAALAFFGVSHTTDYASMAALHALAGVAAGCGLTFTHGTIGRSANPHRLFSGGAILQTVRCAGLVRDLAALLERRWSANTVVLVGPLAQAALALVITQAGGFAPYAVASALFVAVMIFTHTFAFGLVAQLDPTGRALAATPAMLMVGAAAGPLLGGTFVKAIGYGSLGFAALVIAALALTSFSRARLTPVQA